MCQFSGAMLRSLRLGPFMNLHADPGPLLHELGQPCVGFASFISETRLQIPGAKSVLDAGWVPSECAVAKWCGGAGRGNWSSKLLDLFSNVRAFPLRTVEPASPF